MHAKKFAEDNPKNDPTVKALRKLMQKKPGERRRTWKKGPANECTQKITANKRTEKAREDKPMNIYAAKEGMRKKLAKKSMETVHANDGTKDAPGKSQWKSLLQKVRGRRASRNNARKKYL